MGKNDRPTVENGAFDDPTPINYEQKRIVSWLKRVRFRRQLIGGVSEADVWKKLGELNAMYNAALIAERVRYDALLERMRSDTEPEAGKGGGAE